MSSDDTSERDPLEAAMSLAAERLRAGDSSCELLTSAANMPELQHELQQMLPLVTALEQWKSQREYASALHPRQERGLNDYVGPFRLHRRVGCGGMAIVFEAVQEPSGRTVALKMLPWRVAHRKGVKERFLREARTAAALQHAQIVPIFNCGEHEGLPYYSMRLVCGTGLDQVTELLRHHRTVTAGQIYAAFTSQQIDAAGNGSSLWRRLWPGSRKPIETPKSVSLIEPPSQPEKVLVHRRDWKRLIELIARAASALAHAHRRGVWHRDVKPGNLLLDVDGKIWITDFGLARSQLDETPARRSSLAGTLRYMPPEAFAGEASSEAADIYSLGITLYELCTLKPAFPDSDTKTLIRSIRTGNIPPPRQVCRQIPPPLEAAIRRAIAVRRAERFGSMKEFLAELVAVAQSISR